MASTDTSEQIASNDDTGEALSKEELEKRRFEPYVKLPKWLRIILMITPSLIIVGIILIINYTVGFPATINPTAIIAIIGMGIFAITVLGDMVYRNIFVYRMLRHESRKSRVYRQILKERKEKDDLSRQEITDEYEYDDDEDDVDSEEEVEEVEEIEEDEESEESEEYEEEYTYETEDEREDYRLKSFILRGGIMSILIVNSFILLGLAAILQLALFGGFTPPTE